ncbi:MAG: hypothetical protein KC486_08605 [Myxococcales bacterium]|nr:hypothetical protein [Myxococcales bacterium]
MSLFVPVSLVAALDSVSAPVPVLVAESELVLVVDSPVVAELLSVSPSLGRQPTVATTAAARSTRWMDKRVRIRPPQSAARRAADDLHYLTNSAENRKESAV